jgi:hypothetical protein
MFSHIPNAIVGMLVRLAGDDPIVPAPFCDVLNGLKSQGGTLIVDRSFPRRLEQLRPDPDFDASPHFPARVR